VRDEPADDDDARRLRAVGAGVRAEDSHLFGDPTMTAEESRADDAELVASRIPGATTYLHDGGRHGFFEEFAGDVTPRVLELLDR
jgi:hypothetical protein